MAIGTPFVHVKTARAVARLLADEYGYRVRKVDTIRLMEGRKGRRRISLDVLVPDDQWLVYNRTAPRDKRMIMLPVARPHKGVLRDLDTHDATDSALPVLTRRDNTDIAAAAVVYEMLGRKAYGSASPELWQATVAVVEGEPVRARQDAEDLIKDGCFRGTPLLDPGQLSELAVHLLRDLADSFLLIALLPESRAGERTLIKFSFHWASLDPRGPLRLRTIPTALGWVHYPLLIGVGRPDEAQSHHLEIHAPKGLMTTGLAFPPTPLARTHPDLSTSPVAHAVESYISTRVEDATGGPEDVVSSERDATLSLRVPRGGVRLIALFSALFSTLVFTLEQGLPGAHETLLKRADGASALLLAAPAIAIALMIGTDENRLTSHLLRPLRIIIFICSVSLVAGAASLVGQLHEPWITLLWRGGATLHATLFLLLASGYAADTVRGRRKDRAVAARDEGASG